MSEIEELLTYPVVCSYKVINNYPGSLFPIGTIIELRCGPDQRFETGGIITPYAYTEEGALDEGDLLHYPHIYQKI